MDLTRKQALTGLAGILATGVAPAAFVRSIVGARGVSFGASGFSGPTARDYVQDGLIAMWDGIENVAYGIHDSNYRTWNDLKGGRVVTLSNQSFGDSFLHVGSSYAPINNGVMNNAQAVEIVMCGKESTDTWAVVFNEDAWQCAFNFGRVSGKVCAFFIASFGGVDSNYEISDQANSSDINYFCYSLPTPPEYGLLDKADHVVMNNIDIQKRNFNTYRFARVTAPMICKSANVGRGNFDIFAIRFYSRSLLREEISANYNIDKIRFGVV